LSHIAHDDPKLASLVVAKLAKGLSHPDEQTRLEAVSALAKMGPAAHAAKSELERAAKEDSSEEVRDAAEAALHPNLLHPKAGS
jgi:HEAT repeat protein